MSSLRQTPTSATAQTQRLPTSIFLSPIAAPAVLGYFAAATGFLLFGVWLGGGITGLTNGVTMFAFFLFFPGFGQLAAGLLSVRARDAVGASMFMTWGGFWIAYGLLWMMQALGTVSVPGYHHAFAPVGQWFMYMAVITATVALAALGRSPGQFLTIAAAAVAAALAAGGLISGSVFWQQAGGWVFVAASAGCLYHASALMLNALFGKVILPHLSWRRDENAIGSRPLAPVEISQGEPGVKVGE